MRKGLYVPFPFKTNSGTIHNMHHLLAPVFDKPSATIGERNAENRSRTKAAHSQFRIRWRQQRWKDLATFVVPLGLSRAFFLFDDEYIKFKRIDETYNGCTRFITDGLRPSWMVEDTMD